ncbi:MAG: dCTP deaminase, partial [Candidatus Nanohaloarchaea archaeon]
VVHATAGFCDPGFEGQITLEMQNLGNAPVKLYPEDRVCQVVFETMTSEAATPYAEKSDAKYQGQEGATGSKLDREQR